MGFYFEVEERDDDEESECLEIRDGVLEEEVFTVERRRRKVSCSCKILYSCMCAFYYREGLSVWCCGLGIGGRKHLGWQRRM